MASNENSEPPKKPEPPKGGDNYDPIKPKPPEGTLNESKEEK